MPEELEGVGQALDDAASGLSLLKAAERRRAKRQSTLFLEVPSWDGDLICEYRVLPPDKLAKIAQGAIRRAQQRQRENGDGPDVSANDLALITGAAVGLYSRGEDGKRIPIEDEFGQVGYDRIAHVLGVENEISSAREAVIYLMSEKDKDGSRTQNVVAISTHADKISKWMTDTSKRELDLAEIVGEL